MVAYSKVLDTFIAKNWETRRIPNATSSTNHQPKLYLSNYQLYYVTKHPANQPKPFQEHLSIFYFLFTRPANLHVLFATNFQMFKVLLYFQC